MINKIRTLAKVGEEIVELKDEMQKFRDEFRSLSISFRETQKEFKEFEATQKNHSKTMQAVEGINKNLSRFNEEFKEEIYDFKLLKADMQKKIMQRFEDELKQELDSHFRELKTDVQQYNKLKKEIGEVSSSVIGLSKQIDKFTKISSGIKASDFELVQHKKDLDRVDKEKLNLMKKIDTLERLVSKLRRGR